MIFREEGEKIMPLTESLIDEAIDRYWRELDRYTKLAEFVGEACRKELEDNVIRGSVQWRAKNPDRLRGKLQKDRLSGEHAEQYTSLDSIFGVIRDLAGVRVTTYIEADRPRAVSLVEKRFSGTGPDGVVASKTKDAQNTFYRATHCDVLLRDADLVGRYQNLRNLGCEVQVCSLLAHVYNEIEHDLRYKPLAGTLSGPENELLDSLGHLMMSGDTIINQTLAAVEARLKANTAEFEDEYDFVVRLRPLFPTATNFASYAGQLYEVCTKLNLDSPEKIKEALGWTHATPGQAHQLATDLATAVNSDTQTQLEIDPLGSDQLLVLLLSESARVVQLKTMYPSGQGIGRAPRFLSVAKRLQALQHPT